MLTPKAETKSVLTQPEDLEVQREIAFKVVFFFVAFIAACFGLLYVYHRVTQEAVKSNARSARVEGKQNL